MFESNGAGRGEEGVGEEGEEGNAPLAAIPTREEARKVRNSPSLCYVSLQTCCFLFKKVYFYTHIFSGTIFGKKRVLCVGSPGFFRPLGRGLLNAPLLPQPLPEPSAIDIRYSLAAANFSPVKVAARLIV